jgi:hypothetical protein
MGYDIAPGQTTMDKREFYEFISGSNKTMVFEHDMNIWGAKLKLEENGPVLTEKFTASQEKILSVLT